MSSYHSSFKYLNKKSDEDFGWIISHFDPDNGETDSYLSQDQVYTDSYNGSKRTLYGTRWNSVANVKITVIKLDGSSFTLGECREAYKWLTGNPEASWMDLYIGDEVKYRLLCTIQDVKPQKMDARTIGLNIYCESLSPWAYSPLQTVTKSISGSGTIEIDCQSDDLYSFIYPKTTYKNTSGTALIINNSNTEEKTQISGLTVNEVITMDSNQLIVSDKPSKVFGNTFNFVWPRFKSGINTLTVTGTGDITFEYYCPIKMGDCAQNINIVRDPICDDFGNIQVDTLPWERISNTPTTAGGYGITDVYTVSSIYNKKEIDSKMSILSDEVKSTASLISTVSSELTNDYYNKIQMDEKYYDKQEIDYNIYNKKSIDKKINDINFNIKSNASLISTISSELTNNYYNKTYIDDSFYNKSQIDTIISELSYDPSTGTGLSVAWSQIVGKPTTLSEYRVKTEVQNMINESVAAVKINIDEAELNAMLAEVLG